MVIRNLEEIAQKVTNRFEGLNEARDNVFKIHREIIKGSSLSIRATHRGEFAKAREILDGVQGLFDKISSALNEYPELYYAGFVQDAQKEFSEAHVTLALILRQPIPDPDDLGVEYASYVNGMGEAIGELRRYLLDRIRNQEEEEGEDILESMDEIYYVMLTMDFPDAVTRGLRRTTDMVRASIERTRGDLTNNLSQKKLRKCFDKLEGKLNKAE